MKSKNLSTLVYLVINFLVALIVNIVMGKLFGREELISWITVLVITLGLTIISARPISRMAATLEKDGFGAALKSLFVNEKK